METLDRKEYPMDRIQRLLSGIPFFNEILRADQRQFETLLHMSELMQAHAGDVVIRQGDTDTYLYFLLKGQLAVMANSDGVDSVLNYISPGEVFGTLAMIRGIPRSATIKVDDSAREAILVRIDYQHFKDIHDSRDFTLDTRLGFYRMLVHNIRWTLEVNKMQNPQHPLVGQLRTVPIYTGPKNTEEELEALHDQAHRLAEILCDWNASVAPVRNNVQFT